MKSGLSIQTLKKNLLHALNKGVTLYFKYIAFITMNCDLTVLKTVLVTITSQLILPMQFGKRNEISTWHGTIISDPESKKLITLYKEHFSSSLVLLTCHQLSSSSATPGTLLFQVYFEKRRWTINSHVNVYFTLTQKKKYDIFTELPDTLRLWIKEIN